MIKSITITNHLGESIEIILTEPEKSGFIVKSIDGLGPVNANVHTLDLATIDGGLDNGARLGTRNIVLSLGFMGTDIESIRQKSYKYFPIKQQITFKIETDNRICYTVGRVETNTPNIFDKDEGCQISILCNDSYFHDVKDSYINFYTEAPNFEFPFENNSIELSSKNLLTNNVTSWTMNGLTFNVDGFDNISVSGVATATTNIRVGTIEVSTSKYYRLTGCPYKATTNDYCLYISDDLTPSPSVTDDGQGSRVYLYTGRTFSVWIRVYSGVELNTEFKPSVREYQTVDNRYIEYGANYITSSELIWTKDNAEFKIDGNGIVTVNGTLNETLELHLSNLFNLTNGESYILNGCPSGGGNSTYKLDIIDINGNARVNDTGSGATFTKTNDDTYNKARLVIYSGTTLSNKEFKPMIRLSSESDSSYEPYTAATDNGPLLEMGIISFELKGNVTYLGDQETGINIEIQATGDVTGFGIYNIDTGEVMVLSDTRLTNMIGSGIKDGDMILINTNKGENSIRLLRNGVYINILNALEAPISWFALRTGDNAFIFNATTGTSNLRCSMTYKNLYEGV